MPRIHLVRPYHSSVVCGAQNTSFCQGSSVTISAGTGTGWSYQWQQNGSNIAGATGATYSATQGGSYRVVVQNAGLCADTSAAIALTMHPVPVATLTASGPTTFCAGGSVVLTETGGTGIIYNWIQSGSPVTGTGNTFTATTSGSYLVIATNSNGCTATSAAIVVQVNPLPVVTLAPFVPVSVTDPAFALSGGSPAGGTWSGSGLTGSTFSPAAAGVGTQTITYSYTDANGCSASATQALVVSTGIGRGEEAATGGIAVFPNPASGSLWIRAAKEFAAPVAVQLLNSTGQVAFQQERLLLPSDAAVQLALPALAPGLYLLQLSDGKMRYQEQVVVER